MRRQFITGLLIAVVWPAVMLAQEVSVGLKPASTVMTMNSSLLEMQKTSKATLNESKEMNPSETANLILRENAYAMMHIKQKEPTPQATLVSSFRSNIHFAGFWNHYAIINFTPDMFVKPFDFLSIYATHNTSVYVPISDYKNYVKSMAIKSIAIVAIDNSFKFLLPPNKIIQALAGFAAKNIAMSLLKSTYGKQSLEFKYYYYAVSIRF